MTSVEFHTERSSLPTYELAEAEFAELQRTIGASLVMPDPQPEIVCVVVDGLDPRANVGRAIEQSTFHCEFGVHPPDEMVADYGPYEDRSTFFLAWDTANAEVVGVLRCITGTAGLGQPVKSIRDSVRVASYRDEFIDLRDAPVSLDFGVLGQGGYADNGVLTRGFVERYHSMAAGDVVADVATLAVRPEARQGMAGTVLIAGFLRAAKQLRAQHLTTFVRADLLSYLREILLLPWKDLGGFGATQYVEADDFLSQPAYLDLRLLWAQHQQSILDEAVGRPSKGSPSYDRLVALVHDDRMDELFTL